MGHADVNKINKVLRYYNPSLAVKISKQNPFNPAILSTIFSEIRYLAIIPLTLAFDRLYAWKKDQKPNHELGFSGIEKRPHSNNPARIKNTPP